MTCEISYVEQFNCLFQGITSKCNQLQYCILTKCNLKYVTHTGLEEIGSPVLALNIGSVLDIISNLLGWIPLLPIGLSS